MGRRNTEDPCPILSKPPSNSHPFRYISCWIPEENLKINVNYNFRLKACVCVETDAEVSGLGSQATRSNSCLPNPRCWSLPLMHTLPDPDRPLTPRPHEVAFLTPVCSSHNLPVLFLKRQSHCPRLSLHLLQSRQWGEPCPCWHSFDSQRGKELPISAPLEKLSSVWELFLLPCLLFPPLTNCDSPSAVANTGLPPSSYPSASGPSS